MRLLLGVMVEERSFTLDTALILKLYMFIEQGLVRLELGLHRGLPGKIAALCFLFNQPYVPNSEVVTVEVVFTDSPSVLCQIDLVAQ